MNEPETRAVAKAWLMDLEAFGIDDLVLLPPAERTVLPVEASANAPVELRPEASVSTGPAALATPSEDRVAALTEIATEVAACRRCPLHATRTHTVPGQGCPTAEIMFVGEAPGESEDLSGQAFVGKAGELLTKMIHAMGLSRDEVFIANVLKCRPPQNRDPAPEECAHCVPFLRRQIDVVAPRILVALGGHASKNLLRTDVSVGRLRGRVHDYHGTPLVVTYHPAYLLRAPEMKRKAWEDLQFVLSQLGRRPPERAARS